MAENTTTYKAVIDVETKGSDNLGKLNKSLNETLEGFEDIGAVIEKTRKALQKAKLDGDKVEFKRLRKELNGLQKTFEETEITSQRFTDALAAQPGIVGLVGGSIKGLDGGLKVLAANPIIAVVTLLAGLFLTFKEALTKTAEGQETLNKISAAFGKIIGPVMAIVEKVALPIFEKLADLLALVAEGFGKFARFLGISQAKIEEASRNSSEVLQTAYEEEQKRQEDQTKKQEEEGKKRIEQQRKEAEERKKILEDAQKIILEAELSLLSDRDRELKERELRYQEELKQLKLAGITDLTAFEAEYRQDVLDINKSYDDAELQQKQETLDKELEMRKQMESQARADKVARLVSEYEFDNQLKAQSFQAELDLFDKTRDLERQEMVAQGASADALVAFDKQTATARLQIEEAQQEAKLAIVSNALGTLAEAVGKETVAGKALAISQALINTYLGATKALATYPPPFGAIAAGTVIAAGLLQVNAIRKQKLPDMPKPGGGSVSLNGGGGGPAAPTTSFATPQVNFLPQQQNTGTQIAETIAGAQTPVVKAYVVASEVSSVQAFDRRVTNASTL